MLFDNKPWFAQKKFGYGAGLPISWRGWVFLLSYVAAAFGLGLSFGHEGHVWEYAFALITILFILIAWRKTDGGWKWRWGKDAHQTTKKQGRSTRRKGGK